MSDVCRLICLALIGLFRSRASLQNASTERDFDAVFAKVRELRAGALLISQDVFFNAESAQLGVVTVRPAIPAIFPLPEVAAAGGLTSYRASRSEAWHQASIYVGQT